LFFKKIHIAAVVLPHLRYGGRYGVDYGLFFLLQAFGILLSIVVSLTCTSYLYLAFSMWHLVPQIYDNTTRFYANKFGTFDLWKFGGYNQLNTCTNGRRYIAKLGEKIS
jgi:multidrug efflux pump subunit AcrB